LDYATMTTSLVLLVLMIMMQVLRFSVEKLRL
jgi:hypothetical protein